MSERAISLERIVDASVERVYRAWSDPETLTTWFAPRVEGSLAVGARSLLIWPDRRFWLEMLEAEPERRIRFRWAVLLDGSLVSAKDARATDVTVNISPHGYGTRLTLHDGPFEMDGPEGPDDWAAAMESWVQALANLRAQLDFSVDLRRRP
ncbi:MAG: SRPBCC domain-containing protein [Chloroflexi bacterium]|nr:SRPBCC domain-containing protein [Chloroflexota bacterium]MDQ3448242.1 SRPBCC domain-containing protein [Chloroflexota bacterium]